MNFNLIAPCNEVVGYGVHATNVTKAMWRKGVKINYFSIEPVAEPIRHPFNQMLTNELDPNLPTVRIGGAGSPPSYPGSKKIEYMVYEVDKLPASWVRHANMADEFWTTSKWGARVAEESGITTRIKVVPEGVDTEVFSPDGPRFETFDTPTFKFLALGKFEPRKGFDILIDAFSTAFGDNPDVELIIKADNIFTCIKTPGQILEQLLPILENRKLPKMKFVGQLADKHQLATLYRSCDAFVLPTRGEGWMLPGIEAMATGLPVITTGWSAMTEYMNDDNAILLDPGELVQANDPIFGATLQQGRWANPDPVELANKMETLFYDLDLQKRLGSQARKDCETKWTWERSAEHFLAALNGDWLETENNRWKGTASIMPD